MRHLILLSLLASGASWGAGNICTLRNGGTACSSNSCTASLIAADTANNYFTGTGCTANGYTPWTNSDNVVIPSGFTLTDDVGGTYGNYNGPMMSYISSLAVAPNSTTGCSRPTASISGGTQSVYTVNAPSLTTDTSGAITAATLNFERVWYAAGSAQPTVTINGGGCTYLNNYTPATAITPVWVQGGGTPALTIGGGTSAFIAASAVTFRGDIQYNLSSPASAVIHHECRIFADLGFLRHRALGRRAAHSLWFHAFEPRWRPHECRFSSQRDLHQPRHDYQQCRWRTRHVPGST